MSRTLRAVLSVAIYALILAAVFLAIRQFLTFSGDIAGQHWVQAYDSVTKHLIVPFGAPSIKTPYAGRFDVNGAFTILAAIVVEWLLTIGRDRA